jgi:hypothetical protein
MANRFLFFLVPPTGISRALLPQGACPYGVNIRVYVTPEAWGSQSPKPPVRFRLSQKKVGRMANRFLFLVPLTGIEPVRELPPEGF